MSCLKKKTDVKDGVTARKREGERERREGDSQTSLSDVCMNTSIARAHTPMELDVHILRLANSNKHKTPGYSKATER